MFLLRYYIARSRKSAQHYALHGEKARSHPCSSLRAELSSKRKKSPFGQAFRFLVHSSRSLFAIYHHLMYHLSLFISISLDPIQVSYAPSASRRIPPSARNQRPIPKLDARIRFRPSCPCRFAVTLSSVLQIQGSQLLPGSRRNRDRASEDCHGFAHRSSGSDEPSERRMSYQERA